MLSFNTLSAQFLPYCHINYSQNRILNPEAEAMGRAYVGVMGGLNSVYINPAGLAAVKGFEIIGFKSNPKDKFGLENNYHFFKQGYRITDYIMIGLSTKKHVGNNYFSGEERGNKFYVLTLASKPIRNLFFGFNINYNQCFQNSFPTNQLLSNVTFDFGVIQKIPLVDNHNTKQFLNIGSSITNLTYAKFEVVNEEVPTNIRAGFSYEVVFKKDWKGYKYFSLLIQNEFQHQSGIQQLNVFKGGVELVFFDCLKLRSGFLKESFKEEFLEEYENFINNKLTFGIGLQLPLDRIMKIPINISIDYSHIGAHGNDNTLFNPNTYQGLQVSIQYLLERINSQ